jgi:hypothetical protein
MGTTYLEFDITAKTRGWQSEERQRKGTLISHLNND